MTDWCILSRPYCVQKKIFGMKFLPNKNEKLSKPFVMLRLGKAFHTKRSCKVFANATPNEPTRSLVTNRSRRIRRNSQVFRCGVWRFFRFKNVGKKRKKLSSTFPIFLVLSPKVSCAQICGEQWLRLKSPCFIESLTHKFRCSIFGTIAKTLKKSSF